MQLMWTLLLFSIFGNPGTAQMNPVEWNFKSRKITDTEYDLLLTAQVNKGWFIYSQFLESDEGPVPTSFTFHEDDSYELIGETQEEGHKKEGFDDIFGMNLIKFSGEVTFIQRVKLKKKVASISGSLDFMTCDDERCLPPATVEFTIPLKN